MSPAWVKRRDPMRKTRTKANPLVIWRGMRFGGKHSSRGDPPAAEGGAVHWHAVAVGHTMSEVFGGNTEFDEPEECFYRVGAQPCSGDNLTRGKKTGGFVWAPLSKTDHPAGGGRRDQSRKRGV